MYVFNRLKNVIGKKTKLGIYHALFSSIATYGIVAWGGAYDGTLKNLQSLQKRLLKIIFYTEDSDYLDLEKKSQQLLTVKQSSCFHSLVHNFISLRDKSLSKGSRTGQITPSMCTKKFGQKSCRYKSIKTYNMLPKKVKHLTTKMSNIKKVIKEWLINNINDKMII